PERARGQLQVREQLAAALGRAHLCGAAEVVPGARARRDHRVPTKDRRTMILYRLIQRTVRFAWPRIGTITVLGLDNIPSTGPSLPPSTPQRVLNAILIQAYCPRLLPPMPQSTQFAAPVIGPLRTRLYSFPVRRYEIDPQAVRPVLRRLGEGHGVGIYIEGERSWDGKLQAPRLGTVRLILKAGVPVIPATISGSYDAWPRWASGVRPAHVTIAYGR